MAGESGESSKVGPPIMGYEPPAKVVELARRIINADTGTAFELERSRIRATFNGLRDGDPGDQPDIPELKQG